MSPTEQEIRERCDALYTTHYRRGFSREDIFEFYQSAYAAGLLKGLEQAAEVKHGKR